MAKRKTSPKRTAPAEDGAEEKSVIAARLSRGRAGDGSTIAGTRTRPGNHGRNQELPGSRGSRLLITFPALNAAASAVLAAQACTRRWGHHRGHAGRPG